MNSFEDTDTPSRKRRRVNADADNGASTRSNANTVNWSLCFVCQKYRRSGDFKTHLVQQGERINKIKAVALATTDDDMLGKILDPQCQREGRYHNYCMLEYLNRTKPSTKKPGRPISTYDNNDSFFADVEAEVFKNGKLLSLAQLQDIYSSSVSGGGDSGSSSVSGGGDSGPLSKYKLRSMLEERYGARITIIPQRGQGRSSLVMNSKMTLRDFAQATQQMDDYIIDDDIDEHEILRKAAAILHKTVRDVPLITECNSVDAEMVEKVIPTELMHFVRRLVYGDDTSKALEGSKLLRINSLCQDVIYSAKNDRIILPKQLSIGMAVHQLTRSKKVVHLLHNAGHSISYDQIRKVDTTIAQNILDNHMLEDTVVPPNLVKNKFVHLAADNIDINEDTIDGKDTFHACQMVVYQMQNNDTISVQPLQLGTKKTLRIPIETQRIDEAPMVDERPQPTYTSNHEVYSVDQGSDVNKRSEAEILAWLLCRRKDAAITSFAGFFRQVSEKSDPPGAKTVVGFMPIINAPAHDPDTLWTVMNKGLKVTCYLNPGQPLVVTLDMQTYTRARELIWAAKRDHEVVLKLGSFHILMTFLIVLGQYLAGSGVKEFLTDPDVDIYGEVTAEKILNGKSYSRAVRAHKLLLEALFRQYIANFQVWLSNNNKQFPDDLNQKLDRMVSVFLSGESSNAAFEELVDTVQTSDVNTLMKEYDNSLSNSDKYWRTYMDLVHIMLKFISAERSRNFERHLESFSQMLPWFAVFNHPNYLKMGTVYLDDMKRLSETHPTVHAQFMDGNFTVKTEEGSFAGLSTDLQLEYVNRSCKVAGGLVGISRNESARERWSLTYNERSRITSEALQLHNVRDDEEHKHRDLYEANQKRDVADVRKMDDLLVKLKVFLSNHDNIVCLITNDVTNSDVTNFLLTASETGRRLVQTFTTERLICRTVPYWDPLTLPKPINIPTMYETNKVSGAAIRAQNDQYRKLFRRLMIAIQAGREINLQEISEYELTSTPMSICDNNGNLRQPENKAALQPLILGDVKPLTALPKSTLKTCTIIDGHALIQKIGKPKGCANYGDVADRFSAAVRSHFSRGSARVDVVFDVYIQCSAKNQTRDKRAKNKTGIRRIIDRREVPLPTNWTTFICMNENKSNLAEFLTNELFHAIGNLTTGGELIVSGGRTNTEDVVSSRREVPELHSSQEEADTKMLLHARHACEEGYERIIIESRDTDVLILSMYHRPMLSEEVWVSSGLSGNPKFVPIHSIVMDEPIRRNLLGMHAITGCDTVSQFFGIGKKTAWNVFIKFPTLLSGLITDVLTDEVMKDTERFICLLYDSSTPHTHTTALRHEMFMSVKDINSMPPTSEVTAQHIKRAWRQILIWAYSLVPRPNIPSLSDGGWILEGETVKIDYGDLKCMPKNYQQLTACACKKCTKNCGCLRSRMPCIPSCKCYKHKACENRFNRKEVDCEHSDCDDEHDDN